MERICCACQIEKDVVPVRFNLLKTAYMLGPMCRASWRIEAQSLGRSLFNPARVHMAFQNWLKTRKAAA